MNLTPVKVRGKGPRKVGFKQPNPKRLKLTPDGEASKTLDAKKKTTVSINDMPKEILEPIMLFSREPNFLYASSHAWRNLRWDPSFLTRMVLDAFQETWDIWLGLQKAQVHSYTGWAQDMSRFGGDPEYQSKVIALPFMTFELVMAAQQCWIVKNGQGLFYQHSGDYNFDDHDPEGDRDDDDESGINDGVTKTNGLRHGVKGLGHFTSALACFEEEWQVTNYTDFYEEPVGGAKAFRLEIHPEVRIPDRLITGPMRTMSDAKLLYWLVHSGAKCADDQSWEMSLRNVHHLFEQDDEELADIGVHLLYMAGGFRDMPTGTLPIPLAAVSKKLLAHRKKGPWKSIIDGLFDLAGLNEILVMMSHGL